MPLNLHASMGATGTQPTDRGRQADAEVARDTPQGRRASCQTFLSTERIRDENV